MGRERRGRAQLNFVEFADFDTKPHKRAHVEISFSDLNDQQGQGSPPRELGEDGCFSRIEPKGLRPQRYSTSRPTCQTRSYASGWEQPLGQI